MSEPIIPDSAGNDSPSPGRHVSQARKLDELRRLLPPEPDKDGPPERDPGRPALPTGMHLGFVVPEIAPVEEPIWLRFEPDAFTPVRVLSDDVVHYWAHWYPAGRVYRLCLARQHGAASAAARSASCPLCPRPGSEGPPLAGPAQLRYILPVETETGAQRVWEFSDPVAKQLQALTGWRRSVEGVITRERDLLGMPLLLSRLPPRSNGAVVVQLDPVPAWGAIPSEIVDAAGFVKETWRRAAMREGKAAPKLPF